MRGAMIMMAAGALATAVVASGPAQGGDEAPMLGATLSPSKLTLHGSTREVTTNVRNRGNIPVVVSATVGLPGYGLIASGWSTSVEPEVLEPGEWAVVTLANLVASPSDVVLDVRMGSAEATAGNESMALSFPIDVSVEEATPTTTAVAWLDSVLQASVGHLVWPFIGEGVSGRTLSH